MTRHLPAAIVAMAVVVAPAFAQTPDAARRDAASHTTEIAADVIDDLPNDGTIFSLIETTQPSLISDRISAGGAYVGQAPRIGGFLSSSSQTLYRIGDVSVSDPTGSGAPLLLPDVDLWRAIRIATGVQPASVDAPGVVISLDPQLPAMKWTTRLGAAGFGSNGDSAYPTVINMAASPLAVLGSGGWDRASATASGPLLTDAAGVARLSGFFAASWTRGKTRFARNPSATPAGTSGSAFAHLVFAPNDRDAVHTITWVQRNAPAGAAEDNGAHLQASWERRISESAAFRIFGAYTQRVRATPETASGLTLERLTDGPVSQLAFSGGSTVRQWTVGARLPTGRTGIQTLDGGAELTGARERSSSFFQGAAGELVDGNAARVWIFNAPIAPASTRHMTTVNAHVEDSLAIAPGLVVDAGLRFDGVDASADGADGRIRWQTWLPRARAAWTVAPLWQSTIFAGVSRSAYRLPLDVLAVGDPGAPTASVYQWLPAGASQGPKATGALIATVGPGSDGTTSFARIDPDLKRPATDELTIGIEAHPSDVLTLRAVGFLRRERHRIDLTDPGTPATSFTLSGVPDLGLQLQNPVDDQLLPVYERNASSFGKDQYLLTNPDVPAATSKSLEISSELKTEHVILFAGASANQSEGTAAAVGFGPLENDPTAIGDAFVDPNSATFARGRVFTDRAYTIKLAAVLRLPRDVHVGIAARYQDGQPFSRLVVVTDLNQGAEAIRAFPNGQSRFTFTETLDVRLQKDFPIGRDRLGLVLDVFNLLNTQNEVEERTVTGSTFRAVTAVQPPRAFHAGFRITF